MGKAGRCRRYARYKQWLADQVKAEAMSGGRKNDTSCTEGRNIGTNGTAQIAPGCSGSDMLELFNLLNRGIDSATVRSCVDAIVAKASEADVHMLVDLFVLTFQTRDCRGGKGERKLFRMLFLALHEHFPLATIGALPLVVEYGYFKDLPGLYEDIMKLPFEVLPGLDEDVTTSPVPAHFRDLLAAVVDVMAENLRRDFAIVEAAERDMIQPSGLSLAAKYAPRIIDHKLNNQNKKVQQSTQSKRFKRRESRAAKTARRAEKAKAKAAAAAVATGEAGAATPEAEAGEAAAATATATSEAGGPGEQSVESINKKEKGGKASSAAPAGASQIRRAFANAVRDKLCTDPQTGKCPVDASRQYRKLLSRLNEHLRTVERLMCAQRWDEIEPKRIPSLCLKRNRDVFLFEDKSGNIRDPTNDVRVALRQRLLDPAEAGELKGGQLHAHEIVHECMKESVSEGVAKVLEAQWQSIIRTVQKQIDEFAQQQQQQQAAASPAALGGGGGGDAMPEKTAKQPKPTFSLGQLIALVDVSGSMKGTPMKVAVAMGLLVSQLATPLFRGRVLTFESTPRWHVVKGADVVAKVKNLLSAPWGDSTNFSAAMDLILKAVEDLAMRTKQMPVVPDLIVFSDMQFDSAKEGGWWNTAHETICHRFADLGRRLRAAGVVGLPLNETLHPPVITFWNLAAKTTGMVASADTKGVRLLSGFSQSLLKLILAGVLPEAAGSSADHASQVDPLMTLRAALDDQRYDKVREYLSNCTDAPFAGYTFTPSPVNEKDKKEEELLDASCCGGGGGGAGKDV